MRGSDLNFSRQYPGSMLLLLLAAKDTIGVKRLPEIHEPSHVKKKLDRESVEEPVGAVDVKNELCCWSQ